MNEGMYKMTFERRPEGLSNPNRRITLKDDTVRFMGKLIYLTRTEARIVKIIFEFKGYLDADSIIDQIGRDISIAQLSVHICNINAKAKRLCGEKLIHTKRFKGYSIY